MAWLGRKQHSGVRRVGLRNLWPNFGFEVLGHRGFRFSVPELVTLTLGQSQARSANETERT